MVFPSLFGYLGSKFKLFQSLILIQFFLSSLDVSGQEPIRFNHLNSDMGLTSNSANCLIKDYQGFLWIGTDAGLNRFDGITVKPFQHAVNDSTSLVNNSVNTLFEDSRHRIWIGTSGGISILRPESDKFVNFKKSINKENTIDFTEGVKAIRQFKNQIWIATKTKIITCPLDSLSFSAVDDGFKTDEVVPIYFLVNQADTTSTAIWFLSSKGPYYTDGKNFVHRYHNPEHLPIFNYPWYASIYADGDSVLYFSTFHYDGIYTYRPSTRTMDSIPFLHSPESHDIWTLSMCRLNNNELIGVSDNNGLFVFNTNSRTSKFYTPIPSNPSAPSSYHGDQVIVDADGTVFLATDHGLDYQSFEHSSFIIYNTFYSPLRDMKTSMVEDDDGNLWLGLREGLFRYTPKTRNIQQFKLPDTYNKIWSLYYENNSLLLGTQGGLATFSTITKKIRSLRDEIPKAVQDLTDVASTNILKDKYGSYWITLFPYGLVKYNFKSKEYIHYTGKDSLHYLPGQGTISASVIDSNGILWLGYVDNFLSAINTKDNSIKNFSISILGDEKPGNISSILPDNKGNLWIGTSQAGLFKYTIATSTFVSYSAPRYLSSNVVGSIIIDHEHNIWICTSNGINEFNPSDSSYILYNKSDGLPVNQFSHAASITNAPMIMTKDGKINNSSDTYLVSFDPKALGSNPNFPKLIFPSYSVNGKSYSRNSGVAQLNFTYRDKNITFDFAGINFIDPSKTQFEYKLEGYDKEWIYNGNNPTATYSNLPVGNHPLMIRTTNKRNLYLSDDQEVAVMIHVTGPFWVTSRIVLLSLLLCALIFYTVYKIRLDQFKKIQSIRQKISRDLHDEIGSTLSSISINSKVAEKLAPEFNPALGPVLRTIGENARTAMDNMNDIVWAISPASETFKDIMERIEIYALSLLDARNIKLKMDIADSLQDVQLDMQQRKNIYLILREAIHNVAKYSHATHCLVIGTVKNKIINLQVTDDGTGFDDINPSLGGNGLSHMQQRATELNAQFKIHSEKQKGTRISLEFATA
jgi:ligand-binding sensor domain-containing protein